MSDVNFQGQFHIHSSLYIHFVAAHSNFLEIFCIAVNFLECKKELKENCISVRITSVTID